MPQKKFEGMPPPTPPEFPEKRDSRRPKRGQTELKGMPKPMPLPEGWRPTEETWKRMESERPELDLEKVLEDFETYWIEPEKSNKKSGKKINWDRAFVSWVRKTNATAGYRKNGPYDASGEVMIY